LRRVKGRSAITRRVVVRSEYNDANHVPNVTHDEAEVVTMMTGRLIMRVNLRAYDRLNVGLRLTS
jgi:hypothetical protein